MDYRRQRRTVACAAFVALTVGLAVHAAYISRTGADAVYMDTLRLLWQWSEFRQGRLPLVAWWGQHGGAHSGLLFQAVLAANATWFGLDTLLANRLTGVVIGCVFLLLSLAYMRDLRRSGTASILAPVLVVATTAVLCFSFSGYELLSLDLGLGLWLKNLLIFVLFLGHAEVLRHRTPPIGAVAILSLYGMLVILLCAMGWSYAVVGAVWAVQGLHHVAGRTWPTLRHAALPLSLATTMLAISIGKRLYFGHADEAKVLLGTDSLRQWFMSLASTFINGETAARLELSGAILVSLGLVLAVGFLAATLMRMRDGGASWMPVHLMAYASLCALSFVMARGAIGDDAVMASRYHMDVFPGLVGLLWIVSMPLPGPLSRRASTAAMIALVCITLVFQWRQARVEWGIAPYRNTAFDAMNAALKAGVPNEAAANLLQSPIEDARNAVAVMRHHRLGVFRDSAPVVTAPVRCPLDWKTDDGWYAREQGGIWSSGRAVFEVPACACEYRATLYLPEGYSPRQVIVSRDAGTPSAPVATLELAPGGTSALVIPPSPSPRRYLLAASRTTTPAQEGINSDVRSLGVFMRSPQISCASAQ